MISRLLPWSIIVLVAFGLRVIGLRYGLPAVYNPDEAAIMSRALAFAKGDLNPHNFLYPTFYFYVLFLWEGLTAALAVAMRAVASFGAFQREFFLDPTRVFVAGRLLTALLGTATVVATGVLGTRIAGRFAGVAAAILLAVAPLHVLNSHYVKHDVPVTFLIVLAHLAYERLVRVERGSVRALIIAAAVTGVAFSTHYYAIFLAFPLAWTAVFRVRDPRDAIGRIAIAAIVSAAVFFLLSPFLLAEPGIALRDIRANRAIVVGRAAEQLGYLASAARYALLLPGAAGLMTTLVATVGLLVGLWRRPARTAWLLAFPLPFLLFIFSTYPASRYIVPITPFIALFAGIGLNAAWSRMGVWSGIAAAALVLTAAAAAGESIRTDHFLRQTDTRTLALDYIRSHVSAGATILIQPYSVPLIPTADVLREAVRRTGQVMPVRTRLEIEREPYPAPAYRVVYLGVGLDADKIYVPYTALVAPDPLRLARAEGVEFVVLKRYNNPDPETKPLLEALAADATRMAVFSPYRDGRSAQGPEPFLHNTDNQIDPLLERPGPVIEIWQLPRARLANATGQLLDRHRE